MRKTFAAAVVVGVACMGAGVQRENGQDRSLEDQFEFVAEFHLGDVPRLDRRRAGESGAGGIAREEFGLQAGRTYFIVGVCDVNCSDIRLRLLGPDGASVAEHVRGGLYAIAGLTPETSGVFAVEVSMVECAAASCGWAVQAYARGTPFTDAARRHDGALAAGDDRYPTGDEFFDTYALDASAGEILIADLRSERFSPYLAVEAPSGAVLTDGDYGRNRSGVEVAVTETGRWTVRVTAVEPGSAGRYRLRLEARAPEGRTLLGPPVEGSPAEAGRGAVEAATAEPWPWSSYWHWRPREAPEGRTLLVPPVEGSLARGDQRLKDGRYADTHVFQGAAGDRATIELGTADGFDAELMLFAPDGELVEENDDEGFWHARIQVELESTGEYGVVVTSSARGRTGSYVLRVTADLGARLPW